MTGMQRLSVLVSVAWIGFWFAAYVFDGAPFRWDGFMLFGHL